VYKRQAGEPSLKWSGEVGHSVDWEVLSNREGRDGGPPVEGKVDQGKAYRQMRGRVQGSEGGETEEGSRGSCGGWVAGRGSTGDP